jgi:1-aminocyclopropane-1-carboxylate deaminase
LHIIIIITVYIDALITLTLTNIKERLALQLPSPLVKVDPRELDIHVPYDISLWLKQDDAIHPIISGNKWRKLAPTFDQYLTSQQKLPQQIISFGGGYSNHLHALGYICKIFNIEFHAFIRGNYAQRLTPCLVDLHEWGTTFHWLTKIQYKQRHQIPYLSALQSEYPQALIIPEGGSNEHAPIGVAQCIQEIVTQLKQVSHNIKGTIKPILQQRHVIVTPVATAATLAGLIYGIAEQKESCPHLNIDILGIAVLKGHPKEAPDYLESLTNKHLSQLIATQHLDKSCLPNWTINHAYHAGGYAKTTPELLEFCTKINARQNKLEPTYSGKVAFAIKQLIENQVLLNYDNIIMLHTGGLQGLRKS